MKTWLGRAFAMFLQRDTPLCFWVESAYPKANEERPGGEGSSLVVELSE